MLVKAAMLSFVVALLLLGQANHCFANVYLNAMILVPPESSSEDIQAELKALAELPEAASQAKRVSFACSPYIAPMDDDFNSPSQTTLPDGVNYFSCLSSAIPIETAYAIVDQYKKNHPITNGPAPGDSPSQNLLTSLVQQLGLKYCAYNLSAYMFSVPISLYALYNITFGSPGEYHLNQPEDEEDEEWIQFNPANAHGSDRGYLGGGRFL